MNDANTIDAIHAELERVSNRHMQLMTADPENPFEYDSQIDHLEGQMSGLRFALETLTGHDPNSAEPPPWERKQKPVVIVHSVSQPGFWESLLGFRLF